MHGYLQPQIVWLATFHDGLFTVKVPRVKTPPRPPRGE
jgi:hypothetical protein